MLAGSDAKARARPASSMRSTEPDRSPTKSAPSGPNANPHATPRSLACSDARPSASTRRVMCVRGRRRVAPQRTRAASLVTENPTFSSAAAKSRFCSKQ